MKEFTNLRQLKKYFNKEDNAYYFYEKNGTCFDVMFNFDVDVGDSCIEARNIINSCDIKASIIRCGYIDACDINTDTLLADDVNVCSIKANHIEAYNMIAHDIKASYINVNIAIVNNIKAARIDYSDACIARGDIRYEVVENCRKQGKGIMHALDGKCIVEKYEKEEK